MPKRGLRSRRQGKRQLPNTSERGGCAFWATQLWVRLPAGVLFLSYQALAGVARVLLPAGYQPRLPTCPTRRPNRAAISRRPRLVTPKTLLSRSGTTHLLFSAISRIAAPSAPPTCGRRSLQSRHAYANRRRSFRVASVSMPSAANLFVPSNVGP